MTIFNSTTALTPPRTPRFGSVIGRIGGFVVPAGFLQASDEVAVFIIPAGAIIMDMSLVNKSTGQTLNAGIDGSPTLFFTAVPDDDTLIRLQDGIDINVPFAEDTMVKATFNTADPSEGGFFTMRAYYSLEP